MKKLTHEEAVLKAIKEEKRLEYNRKRRETRLKVKYEKDLTSVEQVREQKNKDAAGRFKQRDLRERVYIEEPQVRKGPELTLEGAVQRLNNSDDEFLKVEMNKTPLKKIKKSALWCFFHPSDAARMINLPAEQEMERLNFLADLSMKLAARVREKQ